MGFYKKIEDDILNGENFVFSPSVTLKAEDKDLYEYPQDGWYWFDTFDEALVFFVNLPNTSKVSITMRQARLYLLSKGLLDTVNNILSENEALKIEWEYATEILRYHYFMEGIGEALGLDSTGIDNMFIEAGKL